MSEKRKEHLAWIDILRGLASLGVVVFHVRRDLWVGWTELQAHPDQYSLFDRLAGWLSAPTPFLGSGVMLFFLLSGFCIHYPQAGARRWDVKEYAARRFWRIYPPYLAAVLFTVLAERLVNVIGSQIISGPSSILASAVMIQNYGFGQLAGNPSLWSLPVEMELYLVYPLVLLLLWKLSSGLTLGVVGLVSMAAMVLPLFSGADWVAGNFAKFWIIWCAGAYLAECKQTGKLPPWKPWLSVAAGVALLACVAAHAVGIKEGPMHHAWAAVYFLLLW
ncbi:MAG: acyltransferase, partial [Akkermansiaceae bacterium]|nr:acyltransferase [Verrucomicrobiales bacterium]